LPDEQVNLVEGESHSMVRRRWGQVLAALKGAAAAAATTTTSTSSAEERR
jgi:hypothetical protein